MGDATIALTLITGGRVIAELDEPDVPSSLRLPVAQAAPPGSELVRERDGRLVAIRDDHEWWLPLSALDPVKVDADEVVDPDARAPFFLASNTERTCVDETPRGSEVIR